MEIRMTIDEFWKRLNTYGVTVPEDIQRQVGLDMREERVMIRPPAANNKVRVIEYGTSVPAAYVARTLGITVRQVRKHRSLLR
jgi:uncharacterized Zn finger protein